MTKGVDGKN
jgi:hypothetical protein